MLGRRNALDGRRWEHRSASFALALVPRLSTGHQPWGNIGVTGTLAVEMTVLLRPELAIERAAFKQHTMWAYVVDFALLHD